MSHDYWVPRGSNETDYDITTLIEVHGAELAAAAAALRTQAQAVAGHISAINSALASLELGWAGASEREAADFIARWNAVAVALFGTEAATDDEHFDAADGVLNVLASGLVAVLVGFNEAEAEVLLNFTNMFTALNSTTDAGTPPATTGGTDPNDPVTRS